MSDLNLYSVNWQDGMLVTEQHLSEQARYLEELAQWYALGAGDNWGLVCKSTDGRPALSMNLMVGSGKLRVEVTRCQAVTPGGGVIEINESNQASIRAETRVAESAVPVFVGLGAAAKKQVGDPDPREDVPRVPYLVGNYLLSLGEPPSLPDDRYLQIAELTIDGNEVTVSDAYFPPCLTLAADERLAQRAHDYRNRLENLLSLSSRAYAAVASEGAMAGEKTALQDAFKTTIYQIAAHLSGTLDRFVTGRNAPHPLYLVLHFKSLFRVLSTLLNLQPGLKDYLNEKFFVRELNTEVGRFVSSIDAFVMAEYDHRNLGTHLREIDDLLGQVRALMGFFAQVKKDQLGAQAVATDTLTYKGRTYRVVDYATSQLEQVGGLNYLIMNVAESRPIADLVVLMNKELLSAAEWNSMQVRLGLNEARGLGETDPVDIDTTAFGNKVALRPQDMLRVDSVSQITLILRGSADPEKFANLGKMDLIAYAV